MVTTMISNTKLSSNIWGEALLKALLTSCYVNNRITSTKVVFMTKFHNDVVEWLVT